MLLASLDNNLMYKMRNLQIETHVAIPQKESCDRFSFFLLVFFLGGRGLSLEPLKKIGGKQQAFSCNLDINWTMSELTYLNINNDYK